MKKYIPHILAAMLPVLFFLFVIGIAVVREQDITHERKNMESHIGEKVVINKDTIYVVDYSFFMKTYTMSNGTKVDQSFINNKNSKK